MEENPSYYAVIPSQVRYDSELSPNEKLLYGEITALASKMGECFATNNYFAELYNVHFKTVSKWIQHLKDKGYIHIEMSYKEGTKNIEKRIIRVNGIPIRENVTTYTPNSGEGIHKKTEDNNTSINNIKNNNIRNINITHIIIKKRHFKTSYLIRKNPNNFIVQNVIEKLNKLTGSKFNPKGKATSNLILNLLEDYTEEDLILVVEKMCYKWGTHKKGEKDMSEYLRPSTLFRRSNFENYLGMKVERKNITTSDLANYYDFKDF